jgi:hypothetical protein
MQSVMSLGPARAAKLIQPERSKGTEMPTAGQQPRPLPAPNSEFYELAETLSAEELSFVKQLRGH